MAKAKKVEDVNEKSLKKLTRIEDLLISLVVFQASAVDANLRKVARLLGVNNARISRVSGTMKRKKAQKAQGG
jgi:hypothetical protein